MILVRLALALFEFLVIFQLVQAAQPYGLFMLMCFVILLWDEAERTYASLSHPIVSKYRGLQLLEKLINSSVRTRVFPGLAIICPSVQVMSGFAIIKSPVHGPLAFIYFTSHERFSGFVWLHFI